MQFHQLLDICCSDHIGCILLGTDPTSKDFHHGLVLVEVVYNFGMDLLFHQAYNCKLAND